MGTVTSEAPHEILRPAAIHIGVDIGQKVDPTAIVVVEVSERQTDRLQDGWAHYGGQTVPARVPVWETVYTARLMERVPLNTAYPEVAARLVELLTNLDEREMRRRLHGFGEPDQPRRMYVDATGVGGPVIDILKGALRTAERPLQCSIYPLTFTHGDKYDRGAGRLGKAFLVSRLQALMQTGCIRLPANHPEAEAMARELKDYEIRIESATANDTYGAFKVGSHDDLVTALGLCCLEDPASRRVGYGPRIF